MRWMREGRGMKKKSSGFHHVSATSTVESWYLGRWWRRHDDENETSVSGSMYLLDVDE